MHASSAIASSGDLGPYLVSVLFLGSAGMGTGSPLASLASHRACPSHPAASPAVACAPTLLFIHP